MQPIHAFKKQSLYPERIYKHFITEKTETYTFLIVYIGGVLWAYLWKFNTNIFLYTHDAVGTLKCNFKMFYTLP